jgi:hypothetical protein
MCAFAEIHADAICVRDTPKYLQVEKESARKLLEKYKSEQVKLLTKQAKEKSELGHEQSNADEQVKNIDASANLLTRYLEPKARSVFPPDPIDVYQRKFPSVVNSPVASSVDPGSTPVFHTQTRQVLVRVDAFGSGNSGQNVELKTSDFNVTADGRAVDVQYFHEVITPPIMISAGSPYFELTGRGAWAMAQTRQLIAGNYYVLGFTPPESVEGVCHQIKVIIGHVPGNSEVLSSPTRYCYSHGEDPLAGTKLGNDLERSANDSTKEGIDLKVAAWPFYVAPNIAQLQVNLSFPKEAIHQWLENLTYYNVRAHVLGVIYGKDGKLAARFSDNYDQITLSTHGLYVDFAPMQYATELNLPPGEYTLKVALSDDKNFGTAQTSFRVDPYDGRSLGLSAIALTAQVRSLQNVRFDRPRLPVIKPSPLVSQGVQYLPETAQAFDLHEPLYLYFELYEPGLQTPDAPHASTSASTNNVSTPVSSTAPPKVEYRLRLVSAQSGAVAMDTGRLDAAKFLQQDSIVIPIGEKLNLGKLAKGCYRLEVQGFDSLGQQTPVRAEAFCVQ